MSATCTVEPKAESKNTAETNAEQSSDSRVSELRENISKVGHNLNCSERPPVQGQVLRLVQEGWKAPQLLELAKAEKVHAVMS